MKENVKQEELYGQIRKNTVQAKEQLTGTEEIRFEHGDHSGARILFVGNSMTLHGVKEDIGWNHCWGMAASAKEKDYVHCLMRTVREKDPNASFYICQASEWERRYKEGKETYPLYEEARQFQADILIMRLIENCPVEEFDAAVFKNELGAFLAYLNPSGKAKVVMTTGFWRHPGDEAILELSRERNWPVAELGDLGEMDSMKAIGLFEHAGVANHPGDLGMEKMAERIYKLIEKERIGC